MESKNRTVWVIAVIVIAVVVCLCVVALAAALAGGYFIANRQVGGPLVQSQARTERTFEVSQGASLRIDNFAGDLELEAGPAGQIQVTAIKSAPGSGNLDRITISFDQTQGGLVIQAHKPVGLNNASVRFEIVAPLDTPLDLSTGAGSVTVQGFHADAKIDTGAGSIDATDLAGTVDLHTGAGSITTQGVEGQLNADTGAGGITIQGSLGPVTAHSGIGDVSVVADGGPMTLTTGSGGVEFEGAPTGTCEFRTGTGSVVLRLLADLNAQVNLDTGIGNVNIQFPVQGQVTKTHVDGVIGSGQDANITAHTGAGDVEVYQY